MAHGGRIGGRKRSRRAKVKRKNPYSCRNLAHSTTLRAGFQLGGDDQDNRESGVKKDLNIEQ